MPIESERRRFPPHPDPLPRKAGAGDIVEGFAPTENPEEPLVIGLGVDPHEGLESVFLQNVFRPPKRSQHLCHRGMRDHHGMLRNHVTVMASFRRGSWWSPTA